MPRELRDPQPKIVQPVYIEGFVMGMEANFVWKRSITQSLSFHRLGNLKQMNVATYIGMLW